MKKIFLRKICGNGNLKILDKPGTPDPFINSALTSIGFDPDGAERFWTSSLNNVRGPTSTMVDEYGRCRIYRHSGINCTYAVVVTDPDTLWLAGNPAKFIRLTLSTGEEKSFPFPAGRFITSGMAFDVKTGKLFSGAFSHMVSFDTKRCKFVRVYDRGDISPDNSHYDHWRNPDGTYGFILTNPGLSYLWWDPRKEAVGWQRLLAGGISYGLYYYRQLKYIEAGKVYLPLLGWLDGMSGKIKPHKHPPEREASWFGRRGKQVFGVRSEDITIGEVVCWDSSTGEVVSMFTVPDVGASHCALTKSGKILVMDTYGQFKRYDCKTGLLELTRIIGKSKPHCGHTVVPAGKDTVVGTPFISQNFWVLNTRTGQGYYAGRAAGSAGQIDNAINVGGKVYFSAYGGSELTEYDPDQAPGYPHNPRRVAQSKQGEHGRGMTTDGRIIWCAYEPKYGTLDGAMIRYDTQTGEAAYKNGALKYMHIVQPMYDFKNDQLVASSSFLSDGDSAVPRRNRFFVVIIDPITMEIRRKVIVPKHISAIKTLGPLGKNKWLMRTFKKVYIFDVKRMTLSAAKAYCLPEDWGRAQGDVQWAGQTGLFVVSVGDEIRLWDAHKNEQKAILKQDGCIKGWWVHGRSIYLDCGEHVAIAENVLPLNALST